MLYIEIAILICLALGFGGFMIFTKHQMSTPPGLSFKEALEYSSRRNGLA